MEKELLWNGQINREKEKFVFGPFENSYDLFSLSLELFWCISKKNLKLIRRKADLISLDAQKKWNEEKRWLEI